MSSRAERKERADRQRLEFRTQILEAMDAAMKAGKTTKEILVAGAKVVDDYIRRHPQEATVAREAFNRLISDFKKASKELESNDPGNQDRLEGQDVDPG